MELKRIKKVGGFKDAKHVKLSIETDGAPLEAFAETTALNDMMTFIGIAMGEIRKQGGSVGSAQAHRLSGHHVDVSDDGKHILLQLTTQQGYTQSFVLPAKEAGELNAALTKSLQAGKKPAKKPPPPPKKKK